MKLIADMPLITTSKNDMRDENIRTTLRDYVTNNTTWFNWYHNIERLKGIRIFIEEEKNLKLGGDKFLTHFEKKYGNPIDEVLVRFLNSTLDEVRLKNANDFSKYALYISDKHSFSYFRRAESKREMSGEIDYDKQRDHAVHTLYNYLLGWYIFENIPAFSEAFKTIFAKSFQIKLEPNKKEHEFYEKKRFMQKKKNLFLRDFPLVNQFGDVWPIASLLHDVGYILEGSLSPATPKIEHDRVINGTKVIHDYFNHWLWRYTDVDFRAAIDIANALDCVVPDFKTSKSIPALSDHLRDVGNLKNIDQKRTKENIQSLNEKDKDKYALNLEAFELWELFYKNYFKPDINMGFILNGVKEEYANDIWEGGILSKINLNHGVCGGLMLLQAATFRFEFMWGLSTGKPYKAYTEFIAGIKKEPGSNEPVSKETFKKIRKAITKDDIPAHIWLRRNKGEDGFNYMDWVKDLWATSAVAIHDYTTKESWTQKFDKPMIELGTDPLAYLEVLVDVLQEWDRYTVLGESAFSENALLQSYETQLIPPNSCEVETKLKLTYPPYKPKRVGTKNHCQNIKDTLSRILVGWEDHIDIE